MCDVKGMGFRVELSPALKSVTSSLWAIEILIAGWLARRKVVASSNAICVDCGAGSSVGPEQANPLPAGSLSKLPQ